MRKKAIAIAFIALVAVTGAFAKSNTQIALGASAGYSQFVTITDENVDNIATDVIPVSLDAMFYLGDFLAVNAAIGMDIYTEENLYGEMGLSLGANVYYNMELSKTMNLLLGGGVAYHYSGDSATALGVTTSYSKHMLSLLGSVRFEFEATDSITTFAALEAGFNVMNKYSASTSIGGSVDTTPDMTVIPWGIKAGFTYKF